MNALNLLKKLLSRIITRVFYSFFFQSIGKKTTIYKPYLLANTQYISIGKNCSLRKGLRLEVVQPAKDLVISIGNNVNIEQNVHIIGHISIKIGNNVSIAGHCSIVDVVHPYDDIHNEQKIGERISHKPFPVSIGDSTFIGFGAHIAPGVSVGQNCIIGANSVVTKDIPDYSVVAGNPARIIKKYDFEERAWVRV